MSYRIGDRVKVQITTSSDGATSQWDAVVRSDGLAVEAPNGSSWLISAAWGTCSLCHQPLIELLDKEKPVWLCQHNLPKSHPLHVTSRMDNLPDDDVTTLCPYDNSLREECPFMIVVHTECYDRLLGPAVAGVREG